MIRGAQIRSWQESMATGNAVVDSEHQRLLRRLDEVGHLSAARTDRKILMERLERFVQEVTTHIHREHSILKGAGFEDLDGHRQEDHLFLHLCHDVIATLNDDASIELNEEALLFLRHQLIQHIYQTDAPLREYFQSKREQPRREQLLAWSPIFSVGEDSVDDEHQVLIEHVNRLFRLMEHPEERGPILMELHDFLAHAREHFANEALLMARVEPAERIAHLAEHDKMLTDASAWVSRIELGEEQPSRDQLLGFIRDWVVRHILFVDMRIKHLFDSGS